MANMQEYEKLTTRERQKRYFDEDFKRRKVSEIERGITGISDIGREYQVSHTAIYKWIYKYSRSRKKQERMVVESMSDTKKIAALKEKIKELEQIVGQKQIQIEFFDKMIELAEAEYGVDIKKNVPRNAPMVLGKAGKARIQNEPCFPGDRDQQAGVSSVSGPVSRDA